MPAPQSMNIGEQVLSLPGFVFHLLHRYWSIRGRSIQAQKLKKGIDTVESCAYAAQHQLLDLDAQQTQPAASTPFSTAFNIAWLLGIANRMSTAPLMRMKSPSADPSNTTAHPPAV